MRLDDRLLGRWLYHRELLPLRVEIAAIVGAIAVATVYVLFSANYWFLTLLIPPIAGFWYRRIHRNRRSD